MPRKLEADSEWGIRFMFHIFSVRNSGGSSGDATICVYPVAVQWSS